MWETEISITFHLHGMADLQLRARKNTARSLLMATLLVCSHSEHDATANSYPTTVPHHILTVTLNAANAANETENTRTIQNGCHWAQACATCARYIIWLTETPSTFNLNVVRSQQVQTKTSL